MKRREFLVGAAAVATAGFARPTTAGAVARQSKQAALDRISIMSLNFQNILKVPDTNPSPERTLELFRHVARSGVEPRMPRTWTPSRRSASTWTVPMKPLPMTAAPSSLGRLTAGTLVHLDV